MKLKYISTLLTVCLIASSINIPAYAAESEDIYSDVIFEEVIDEETNDTEENQKLEETSALAYTEEYDDDQLNSTDTVPANSVSENKINLEDAVSENNVPVFIDDFNDLESDWIFVDMSNLLYMTGAFPSTEDFDFSNLPEMDVFDKLADKDDFSKLIYDSISTKTNPSDVSTYQLTEKQATTRIATVINQSPEFYYANTGYRYLLNADGYVSQIQLFFESFDGIEQAERLAETPSEDQLLEEKADEIISHIDPRWSDEEIALYLHNWLCLNCEYESTNPNCYNAYGAIVEGLAVCAGYSLGYQYLMEKASIPCAYVISYKLNHAWNLIQINNRNYYADLTFDNNANNHICRYGCFLKSQNYIYNHQHESTDWIVIPPYSNAYDKIQTSTDHDDYYWDYTMTPIAQKGNLAVYYKTSFLSIHDYSDNSDTKIHSIQPYSHMHFIGKYLAIGDYDNIELYDIASKNIIASYTIPDSE